MNRKTKSRTTTLDGPILDTVKIRFDDSINFGQYPFALPIIKNLKEIEFPTQVTFFVVKTGQANRRFLKRLRLRPDLVSRVVVRILILKHRKKKRIPAQNFLPNA